MKKASVLLMGLFIIIGSFQTAGAQKEKYHSMFIYNISKYVKWPEARNSGKFLIGVLGTSTIQKELKSMAVTRKVNGMSIEIKQFNVVSEISDCHILYVSASESELLDQVLLKIGSKPVLIITDKPGLAKKGAAINFVEVEGKVKFELNQKNAESKGLKVASSLTSLAIVV